MKKNGILCIVIAIALVMSVGAASASTFTNTVTQTQSGLQSNSNYNAITTGAATVGNGNFIAQGVLSLNAQFMLGLQGLGIINIGPIV